MKIYIRPLREDDAYISYKWRNDSEVWTLTGAKYDRRITAEIEHEWIKNVIADETSKRFAIIVDSTGEYVGNVQLTKIGNGSAEFHIFIGEKKYWGKGISTQATRMILEYAHEVLALQSVFLMVRKENVAAIKSYEKNGFNTIADQGAWLKMEISFDK